MVSMSFAIVLFFSFFLLSTSPDTFSALPFPCPPPGGQLPWIRSTDFLLCSKTIIFIYIFIFGFAGSLSPSGLFSSCSEWGFPSSPRAWASHCSGFSCGARLEAMRASALQRLGSRADSWCTGLVPPRHVGSSEIRDWTPVSRIGRWILYHWTTREVPTDFLFPLHSGLGLTKGRHGQEVWAAAEKGWIFLLPPPPCQAADWSPAPYFLCPRA